MTAANPPMFASTKAVEAALCADCPTPAAKLLLVILASYVDPRMQAFPSFATLKARTGIKSDASLRQHLQALATDGLLRIETDHARNGRQTSNVYTLLVPVPGCTPAPPMDKPRRTHPHSIRRPVDKSVAKAGERRPITPQNLRGHPSKSDPSYPSKSEGLEPSHNNKNTRTPTKAGGAAVDEGQPWKGKRYAAPAAPVSAVRRAFEDDGVAAAGLAELAAALRGVGRSRV